MDIRTLNLQIISSLERGKHVIFRAANVDDANMMLDQAASHLADSGGEVVILTVEPESGVIGINQVRQLQANINAKSGANERLLIAIKNAETMSIEAQNYLLKTLEEEKFGKQFLLASDYSSKILPTVLSRCDIFSYQPPKTDNLAAADEALYRATGYSYSKYSQLNASSDEIADIKRWSADKPHKRLEILKSLKDASDCQKFLDNLLIVLSALLQANIQTDQHEKVKRVTEMIDKVQLTAKRVSASGNIKLNITQLAITI